jgi:hypothetical protein
LPEEQAVEQVPILHLAVWLAARLEQMVLRQLQAVLAQLQHQ